MQKLKDTRNNNKNQIYLTILNQISHSILLPTYHISSNLFYLTTQLSIQTFSFVCRIVLL